MGNRQEALAAGAVEDLCELGRRMADFGRVQADGVDPVLEGQGILECRHRFVRTKVPQETHDQPERDA